MNKFTKYLTAIILSFNIITMPAYAGEVMPAGSVLEDDSYVFTIEEAQELRLQIEGLEKEVEKQKQLVEEYKKLDQIHQDKEAEFDSIIVLKDEQIILYKDLYSTSYNRMKKLEKRRTWEQVGSFSAGIVVSTGLILIADSIDDHIDTSGPTQNINQNLRRGMIEIKF